MKKLLIILILFLSQKSFGQSYMLNDDSLFTGFEKIKPFNTYLDTVKVRMLVSEDTGTVYSIIGYKVIKHEFKKGRGWIQNGDIIITDTNEDVTTNVETLDSNKKQLKPLIIWQTNTL